MNMQVFFETPGKTSNWILKLAPRIFASGIGIISSKPITNALRYGWDPALYRCADIHLVEYTRRAARGLDYGFATTTLSVLKESRSLNEWCLSPSLAINNDGTQDAKPIAMTYCIGHYGYPEDVINSARKRRLQADEECYYSAADSLNTKVMVSCAVDRWGKPDGRYGYSNQVERRGASNHDVWITPTWP